MVFRFVSALLCLALSSGCALFSSGPGAEPAPGIQSGQEAVFDAQHDFEIEVPEGARHLRAWLPMPNRYDRWQGIQKWKVDSPYVVGEVRDQYGNRFLHVDAKLPTPGSFQVKTSFRLTRSEVRARVDPAGTRPHSEEELAELALYLKGSSQSVIDENARSMAREAVGDDKNPISAARKIYDAVLVRIEYHVKDPKPDAEKTWHSTGAGSSQKCFETGTGNCTDFHSLYAAVSRAAGIPTRVVYGSFFKGPLDGHDEDQSYHCWIEFHAPNVGWVPLDVAVADIFLESFQANEHSRPRAHLTVADGYDGPDPSMVDYYFGNLDDRRVTWHWGRDLVMIPPQAGPPLLWNPKGYAEIDGQPVGVQRKLTYEEVPTTP